MQIVKAEVKLSNIFSDNMVIQQSRVIKIWGWADKNESVEVHFRGQVKKAKADKKGAWVVELSPVSYGGPYTLEVRGIKNTVKLENVLVGEVWLASGQSNMEWLVQNVANAAEEMKDADYPMIRNFNVIKNLSVEPLEQLNGHWTVCSPETVKDYSAVAYFFARTLYKDLNIPIGIINSSWGGTDVETWMSPEAVNKLPKEVIVEQTLFDDTKNSPNYEKNKNIREYVKALQTDKGLLEKWYDPATDISTWETMNIPQLWRHVLNDKTGIIWFRYDLDIPASEINKSAVLTLGAIADRDDTWVNGVKVGEGNELVSDRVYPIPSGVLKAGKNTIVVKVEDLGGSGGMYGRPGHLYTSRPCMPASGNMYLQLGDKRYSVEGNWLYNASVTNEPFDYVKITANSFYSLLYNAMINPIINYSIQGAIWYQGENNARNPYEYRTLFPAMINDWRNKWGYEFPFYWVQLANFTGKQQTPSDSSWAEVREAQTMTLSLPKTGETVITDIGDIRDIHPANKQDVGYRLAINALNKDYGKKNVVYSGPTFKYMKIEGSEVIVEFDNIGSGLTTHNKYGYVEGFTLAGNDQKFYWAKAYIDGNTVVVSSEEVTQPIAVRYGWEHNPDVGIYNKENLPAGPFRSDTWKK